MGLSPDYVLDKIQNYEIWALMKNQHLKIKEEWEQARFISHIIALTNGAKVKNVEDIISFPWEKEELKKMAEVSDAELKRLKEKAKRMIDNKQI